MVRIAFGMGMLAAVGAMATLVACSGTDTGTVTGASNDAAVDGALGADGGGDGGASGYTLDNVCDLTGPKLCAQRASCCTATGGYDEAKCLAHAKTECEKDVAAAKAGTMTFDGSKIDQCLTKIAPLIQKCTLEFSDFQSLATTLNGCRIFAGQLGEGEACDRDNQCKPTNSDTSFTSCDNTTKKCKTITLLAAGSTCDFKEGSGGICGTGLYCDIAAGATQGTCKTALALNAACQPSKPLECGLSAYCGAGDKCVKSQAGGATCENFLQCSSLKCLKTGDAGTGQCAPTDPVSKPAECGR